MNGIDAAREIKAELGTPIVFISGYGDPEYIEAAKEIAPFGYVMKPFDERELYAFVEIALSRRKLELKLEKSYEQLEQTNLDLQSEIAARKKTETALQESQKLYRDIFEKNNAMKWLVNPSSGKIIDANPAACEFYQYSHEEITKLRLWDINIESEANVRKRLADASSGGNTEFMFKHRLASGEIRDVKVYTGALESGGKKLLHSIMIDMTERKQAEDKVREGEKKYRLLAENATDVIWTTDTNLNFTYVSPSVERLRGYTPEEAMAESVKENMSPESFDVAMDMFLEEVALLQQGNYLIGKTITHDFELTCKDGSTVWAEVSMRFLFENDSDFVGVLGISRDITQRRRAEDELTKHRDHLEDLVEERTTTLVQSNQLLQVEITERKRAEEQIKKNLKEKEVLLSEIHHRVKNNMQVIISLLRLQSAKIKDKKYSDMFKESVGRIRSMALVHETLYQSKDFENVDFNGYVKSIENQLIRSYTGSSDKIRLKREIEDIPVGLDNAIPCGLIVNELISNSLKHAFPKDREGEIKIVLRAINSDEIELTVSDDGIGIPAEIDIEKTESLGLQIVNILAENQLEGSIELDRDKGTAFRIRFKN